MTDFAALRREVRVTKIIPIIVNGHRWWTNAARTCVAPTKAELKSKLSGGVDSLAWMLSA